MARPPLKVGLLGAGTIATSNTGYLLGLAELRDQVATVAIADVAVERARAVADRFGIPAAYGSLEELLEHDGLDAVINITPIPAHGTTSRQILAAGKHLVVEKPIATTVEEADELIDLARAKGLQYVVAPPNMLQPNRLTARRLVADGAIGQACFARVRSSHGGPASGAWPLDPTWFYQEGSGPLLDMGVYGIHDITGILGPAKRVVAFSGITEKVRTVRAGPFAGKQIEVTADDNTLLMLDFGQSTFAVVDGTFNVNASRSPQIEIFGRSGTINLNNQAQDGTPPLEIFRFDAAPGIDGWITPRGGMGDTDRQRYRRAILVKHLADCVASGVHPVTSAEHARHALEIMVKAIASARSGQALELRTTF
ncbi:MAG TPA: Gfo/Idh/MocA family oxidoreductase [Chloroflexota bacterium]|jgi:predicted dehydrogenase